LLPLLILAMIVSVADIDKSIEFYLVS
jgi:hypothetical protein